VSAATESFAPPRVERATEPAAALAGAAILLMLSVGMAVALYRYPPSWPLVLASGLGLTGVLALAVARYEAAVVLGFLLFSVVRVEPAPTDAVFGIVMAVAFVTGRFNLALVPASIGGLVGIFIVLNLLSMVEAVDNELAGRFVLITLYLAAFSLWFTGYLDSERRARAVLMAYLAGAVGFALLASVALFIPYPGSGTLLRYGGTRATGLFEDPNVLGPFLVPAALIVLEELLRPRLLRAPRTVKTAMFLILVLGVLFAYSRAAWLNLVAATLTMLVVLALRRGGSRKAMAVLVTLLVAGASVLGTVAVTGSMGFLEERAQLQSYDVDRFGAQRTGLELGEQHPIGVGPGQFELFAPISSHNAFVRSLAEQGVLGLFTILALVITTLIFAARNAVLGRDTYGIGSAALLGAWVGIIVNSLFIDSLHWRHLWFVAALIWVGTRRPAAGEVRE
jgi:hypothetical protein